MAPNLFIAAQTIVKPQKWFRKTSPPLQIKQTEEWMYPVHGRYKHTVNGWYLIATLDTQTSEWTLLERDDWKRVVYWHPKHRYELQCTVEKRSREGLREDKPESTTTRKYYCLPTDGATWIQCWDKEGQESVPGPYQRYILDADTRKFRKMTKGDQRFIRRLNSDSGPSAPPSRPSSVHSDSPASSLHASHLETPTASRKASREFGMPPVPPLTNEKRNSLAVPDDRPRSTHRSRTPSPSPLSTSAEELDLQQLEEKIGKATIR